MRCHCISELRTGTGTTFCFNVREDGAIIEGGILELSKNLAFGWTNAHKWHCSEPSMNDDASKIITAGIMQGHKCDPVFQHFREYFVELMEQCADGMQNAPYSDSLSHRLLAARPALPPAP